MDSLIEAGSPAGHAARRRALGTLFRAMAGAALASTLHACGGGGGGTTPEPPPPAPTPAPSPSPTPSAPIAAQVTVPTPVGYDAERLAAFNRLNEIRLSAGLGMVAQSTAMDQAAQAHADWMVGNDVFSHQEQAGTPGFLATDWPLRDEAFGYVPVGGGEVMSAPTHGAAGVDALVNTLYHRAVMLAFEPVDVGIGWSSGAGAHVSMPLVIDVTRPGSDAVRGLGQAAQQTIAGVSIWPLDHATDIPLRLGLENPNPVPSQDVSTLGTPLSITIDRLKTISTLTFVLTNTATGAVVPTQTLTNQNDPNFLIPLSFVAAIPLVVLSPSTTYTARFSGSASALGGDSEGVNRVWSFTTAAR
jgi:uncharacterized protein YkwD